TESWNPGAGGMYDPRESRHVVALNLGLLGLVGVHAPAVEFPIRAIDSDAARTVQRRTAARYALVNPGAAWPNKRWPPARLAAVAAELSARHGLMSVVLWGPGEESLAAEVVAAAG